MSYKGGQFDIGNLGCTSRRMHCHYPVILLVTWSVRVICKVMNFFQLWKKLFLPLKLMFAIYLYYRDGDTILTIFKAEERYLMLPELGKVLQELRKALPGMLCRYDLLA